MRSLLPVLALALVGCGASRPRPDQPIVKDLEIEGTRQLSEGTVKERILTTETPWWEPLWPFDEPNYFDPVAWQADLRRIERVYEAEGYYQAEVVDSAVVARGGDGVALRAVVREGEPTLIGAVDVTGLSQLPAPQREAALADLPLSVGEVFREAEWTGLKEALQGRLREMGYAEAEVGGEVQVDVERLRADVALEARPGPRYRFGDIFVATDPNPVVRPRRIIEQAAGAVRRGEWFSESALAQAQARVFRMGVFGAVKVTRGAPDREALTVPVVVDVREAPFHSIRLGAGVGAELRRQELRAVAEYTDRNFGGALRRLTLRGRVGWAFLPNVLVALRDGTGVAQHAPVLDTTLELEQPRFLFRDVRLQNSLTLEKGLEEAFSFYGGRLRSGVVWQPHPTFSIFPSYNLELFRLEATGVLPVGGRAPELTLGCRERDLRGQACLIFLSYLEQVVEWDRRDDRIEPHRGFYAALALQEGGGPLQGDFSYVRLLPDLRAYRSFGREQRLTLATRVRAGMLLTLPGGALSPVVARFSSGGAFMRGFDSRRLSPQLAVEREPDGNGLATEGVLGGLAAETVPVGGNGLFEASLELRYRTTGRLVLAAFYDTGFVSAQARQVLRVGDYPDQLQHALGVGLRYLTVVGPIRLDIARRLNIGAPLRVDPAAGFDYPVNNDCFGLRLGTPRGRNYAGSPEGLCTFHLSIGEAF